MAAKPVRTSLRTQLQNFWAADRAERPGERWRRLRSEGLEPRCMFAAGLDPTFGTNGIATSTLASGQTSYSNNMVVQSDGKIVVGGDLLATASTGTTTTTANASQFAVVRYTNKGVLDAGSFGSGGIAATAQFGVIADHLAAVAQQPDGKIVAAGYTWVSGSNLVVDTTNSFAVTSATHKFTQNDVNTTISITGGSNFIVGNYTITSVTAAGGAVLDNSPGPTGSTGGIWTANNYDIAVARYTTTGGLDTSFGNGGLATMSVGKADDYGYALAIQSDGSIVVAGYSLISTTTNNTTTSRYDFTVVRFTSAGAADTSFGTNGAVVTALGTGNDFANAVTINANTGQIIVAGSAANAGHNNLAVLRYNANGALDTSFGTGGAVMSLVTGTSNNYGNSVVISPANGNIVVGGIISSGSTSNKFGVWEFTPSGTLATTFGTNGVTAITFNGNDQGNSVAFDNNGNIVIAGSTQSGGNFAWGVARLTAAGVLDTTFNNSGKVTTKISSGNNYAGTVALDPISGNMIVAGSYQVTGVTPTTYSFALASYLSTSTSVATVSIANTAAVPGALATFTATLTLPAGTTLTQAVQVTWTTQDGTAVAGIDYTAGTNTLTFAVGGPLSQTFTVQVLAGATPGNVFSVKLSQPVNAVLGNATATCTVLQPVVTTPQISFGAGPYVNINSSAASQITYTLNLSPATTAASSVTYSITDPSGTVTSLTGAITPTTGVISIPANSNSVTFTLNVNQTFATVGPPGGFTLTLNSAPGLLLPAVPSFTVPINPAVATSAMLQNKVNHNDVNADGVVTTTDAVAVINALKAAAKAQAQGAATQLVTAATGKQMYLDVNGDGHITTVDAVIVINAIKAAALKTSATVAAVGAAQQSSILAPVSASVVISPSVSTAATTAAGPPPSNLQSLAADQLAAESTASGDTYAHDDQLYELLAKKR